MSKIQEPASYRGVVIEHAVSMTKEKGLPQFVAKFRALEKYDSDEKVWIDWSSREDSEITAYLVLFNKTGDPIFHAKDVQKVFEWDGVSLMALNLLELEGVEVQFEVVEHTYNEKTSNQVANIRGYNEEPGGSVKKLNDDELAKLNAQFGASLKKLSGGPKVAKAGKTTTATATAAKKEVGLKKLQQHRRLLLHQQRQKLRLRPQRKYRKCRLKKLLRNLRRKIRFLRLQHLHRKHRLLRLQRNRRQHLL